MNSMEDLLQWPDKLISAISGKLPAETLQSLQEAFRVGICVSTDFSGMGCPEYAIGLLQRTLLSKCPTGQVGTVGIRFTRCTDKQPHCRRVLMNHPGADQRCCFGDMLGRMPTGVATMLTSMLTEAKQELKEAKAEKCTRQEQLEIGSEFMKRALHLVTRISPEDLAQWRQDTHSHCFQHEGMCKVFPPPCSQFKLTCNIAGVNCYDFSSRGARLGWMGDSTMSFLQWVLERRMERDHIVIAECVVPFPHSILDLALGDLYDLAVLSFSPTLLGKPYARKRKYMILTLRSSLTWRPWATARSHCDVFSDTFGMKVMTSGAIFFRAPDDEVQEWIKAMAMKRGLPTVRSSGRLWSYFQVIGPGARNRITSTEDATLAKLATNGTHVDPRRLDFTFDTTQSKDFTAASLTCPALTQRSLMFCMSKRRCQTPFEALETHGFNLYGEALEHHPMCPFKDILGECSEAQLRSLAGNGMDVPSIGAVFLFVLAGTSEAAT